MAVCSNSSDYVASSLVNAFHSIPHRDINLGATTDSFELTLDYFQAIIIWAVIPVIVVLCLFILMSIYFIVVCCCCCCQQHDERSKGSRIGCAVMVFVGVVTAVACCGVGLWAEFSWYSSLNSAVSSARDAYGVVEGIQSAGNAINFSVAEMATADLSQAVMASNSSNIGYTAAVESAEFLAAETSALRGSFDQILQDASIADFSSVLDTVNRVDLIAHWVVVAFLIITILVLLLMMLSVCFGACCSSPICPTLTLFFVGGYSVIVWIAVGVSLGYLVVSGDICADPDGLIRAQLSNASTDLPPGTLDYYLICNETCHDNPFANAQFNASQSLDSIDLFRRSISNYTASNQQPGSGVGPIQPSLDAVVLSLDGAVLAVTNVSTLSNCSQINADYLGVLDGFCQSGYLYSLIMFAILCGTAIAFISLMVLGTFYSGLLAKGRIDDEETIVYDFPSDNNNNGGPSPWESYGTQQRYRNSQQNYGGYPEGMNAAPEAMNMTSTLPHEPPKYTDLHMESEMGPVQDNGGMGTGGYFQT